MLNCLRAVCSQDSNTWRIIVKDLTAFATHVDNFDLSRVIIFTYSDDRIEIIDTSIDSDCQCSCLGADEAKKRSMLTAEITSPDWQRKAAATV